jgi:CRP-like cAMP-binding protein
VQTRPPTSSELAVFHHLLARFQISEGDLQPRASLLLAGECLMTPGDSADLAGLVISGIFREYYLLDDGTERTRGFSRAGESLGSLSDAVEHRPARIFLRAITESVVLLVPWSQIDALAKKSIAWERMHSAIVLRLYLRKAAREYELLALDAAGRYRSFLEQYAGIENEISQVLIASYLGITPEHLSRLKRGLRARRVDAQRAGSKKSNQ